MTTITHHTRKVNLLPCPFCGGKAELDGAIDADTRHNHWRVSCPRCRNRTFTHPHKYLAVAVWNRRVQA